MPGAYTIAPFVGTDWDPCLVDGLAANPEECPDPSLDDHIRFTFDVPEGWAGIGGTLFRADMGNEPPGGAGIAFTRGGQLYSDLCPPESGIPEIAVGPSVDDFVTALVDHPLLDATEPVDVTLAGYSGRYLELQLPSDVTACNHFVWQPGIYAQGPDHLWHVWVLDVDGTRVVVRADTYPGTTQEVRDQIDGILESLRIDATPAPSVAPTAAPSPTIAPSMRPAIGAPADDGARIVAVDTIDERTRDLTIESPAVGTVKVRLLVPTGFDADTSSALPVLYLLHGYGGDHAAWTYDLEAATTTAPTDLLVVMPDADNGWYADAWNDGAGGPPMWETFHLTELPQLLERNWKASDRRVIAGLSMGGLGAMSYAARHPGMFRAAASYSGVLDTTDQDLFDGEAAFGDPVAQADVWEAHNPLDSRGAARGHPVVRLVRQRTARPARSRGHGSPTRRSLDRAPERRLRGTAQGAGYPRDGGCVRTRDPRRRRTGHARCSARCRCCSMRSGRTRAWSRRVADG